MTTLMLTCMAAPAISHASMPVPPARCLAAAASPARAAGICRVDWILTRSQLVNKRRPCILGCQCTAY
eukprot:scaffold317021_cov31-Tisochrysis_lutea.AAC.2